MSELISSVFDHDKFDENPWFWYTDTLLMDRLLKIGIYSLSPDDIEHFTREFSIQRRGAQVAITTDENDVNGFLKFLIHKRAHIEVYSGHDYPEGYQAKDQEAEG